MARFLQAERDPNADTYTVTGTTELHRVTAIRFEVMSDESLPFKGPGRQDNGNLHLSELEVLVNERPIAMRSATADFDQADWGVAKAIDGKPETAWGIYPQVGQSHEAVFRTC